MQHGTGEILIGAEDEAVATVTLNRPERRNAMTLAMWQGLGAIMADLGARPALRAVVLTGAGGHFCAGADIAEFARLRKDAASGAAYTAAIETCMDAIRACPKVTIAAVSGAAMGGGCALAMACDMRVADDTASFGIPAAKLGIVYGLAETRALVETAGLATARRMLFFAERHDAAAARDLGLVDTLAEGPALPAALALAGGLRAAAPLALSGMKTVLGTFAPAPDPQALDAIAAAADRALDSADYAEALAAFAEKRPPVFRGG